MKIFNINFNVSSYIFIKIINKTNDWSMVGEWETFILSSIDVRISFNLIVKMMVEVL